MLTFGDTANERARAELRAVQEAAVKLAIVMGQFCQDAERIAALLQELDSPVTWLCPAAGRCAAARPESAHPPYDAGPAGAAFARSLRSGPP